MQRKTALIFGLALALVVALSCLVLDDELRDRLGSSYYVLALAIIGCVLLLLTGYSWDRSLMQRVKSLREGEDIAKWADNLTGEADHDEIIGLARKIERMARSLQQAEASYRGIVEDQVDLICRCLPDGTVTFANGAYARAFGGKRADLAGQLLSRSSTRVAQWLANRSFLNARWRYPTVVRLGSSGPNGRLEHETDKPAEYQMVGHDISVRKDAEAASLVRAKDSRRGR